MRRLSTLVIFAFMFAAGTSSLCAATRPDAIRVAFNIGMETYAADVRPDTIQVGRNRSRQTIYMASPKYRANLAFGKDEALLQLMEQNSGKFRAVLSMQSQKLVLVGTASPVTTGDSGKVTVQWSGVNNAEKLGMTEELVFLASNPGALRESYKGLRMYTTQEAQAQMNCATVHVYQSRSDTIVVTRNGKVTEDFAPPDNNVLYVTLDRGALVLKFKKPTFTRDDQVVELPLAINLGTGRRF